MFQRNRFAAFLFDMDGTLLTSIAATERVWTRWAERHGLDVPSFLATIHGKRAADTIAQQGIPGIDVEAESQWIFEAEMADTDGIESAAGIAAFLAALPPERWAVVTSALRPLAERRMTAAGLTIPEVIVAAEDVTRGKPAPDGFRFAAERLGVPVEDCLVFEDSPAGIEAGKAAGASVIAITGFQNDAHVSHEPNVRDYEHLRPAIAHDGALLLETVAPAQP